MFSQVYQRAVADYGTIENWNFDETATSAEKTIQLMTILKPYFNISKDCGFEKGCFPEGYYKGLNGKNYFMMYNPENPGRYMLQLSDGSSVAFLTGGKSIAFYYDVNGPKEPNVAGKDLFQFDMKDNKVVPTNLTYDTYGFNNACYAWGLGCTRWIMTYGNMDYLHCKGLDYDIKTSCK